MAPDDLRDDALAGRSFLVASVDGVDALASPTAVLTFGTDGRVHGRASVNRVNGSYRLEDGELLCGPMMSTMMAGPPEAMEQESRLLAVLGRPVVVRELEGGVELVGADGAVTALREIDGEDVLA